METTKSFPEEENRHRTPSERELKKMEEMK